ncbi:hypothetical protein [Rhodococcus sp. MEB041]|uniref:hypothetical protein n=1 Tax=Rhodococcus sp. MEB041 TaxID=3040323 RepID=UPI00254B2510|nr:hypothetical protein [Rhodococcus sp. MEB041]
MKVRTAAVVGAVMLSAACGVPSSAHRSDGRPMLREIDGGATYFSQFSPSLPSDPGFFPIGVWAESVVDDTRLPSYSAASFTTYVEPTPDTDLARIGLNGMYVLSSRSDGPTDGRVTTDEADMWAGPGDATWTGLYPGEGEICVPATEKCGYTVMDALEAQSDRTRLTYTNYGKSVLFWGTDEQSSKFVNDYQDVVSADAYWFTDPNICDATEGGTLLKDGVDLDPDECLRASNYGATVDRVRSLVEPAGSKPVWAFVEVGQPFAESRRAIEPAEVEGAVWSSIIHGAQGVVYFNHSFGGECRSQHVLLDCGRGMLERVGDVNARITELAPVLNSPYLDGFLASAPGLDTMVKYTDGVVHVLAMSEQGGATGRMTLSCAVDSTADVVGEDRRVEVDKGVIVDDFADSNSAHVYRITGLDGCGLPPAGS